MYKYLKYYKIPKKHRTIKTMTKKKIRNIKKVLIKNLI